jgi:hypothetical protein
MVRFVLYDEERTAATDAESARHGDIVYVRSGGDIDYRSIHRKASRRRPLFAFLLPTAPLLLARRPLFFDADMQATGEQELTYGGVCRALWPAGSGDGGLGGQQPQRQLCAEDR